MSLTVLAKEYILGSSGFSDESIPCKELQHGKEEDPASLY